MGPLVFTALDGIIRYGLLVPSFYHNLNWKDFNHVLLQFKVPFYGVNGLKFYGSEVGAIEWYSTKTWFELKN